MVKLGPVQVPGERATTDDKEGRTYELIISFYTRAGTGYNWRDVDWTRLDAAACDLPGLQMATLEFTKPRRADDEYIVEALARAVEELRLEGKMERLHGKRKLSVLVVDELMKGLRPWLIV